MALLDAADVRRGPAPRPAPAGPAPRVRALVWPVVGAALAVLAVLEGVLDDAPGDRAALGTAPGVVAGLALGAAGRWPVAGATAALLTLTASALAGVPGAGGAQLVSMLLALGVAASRSARWRLDAGVLAAALLAGCVAFAVVGGSRTGLWESSFTCAAAVVAWSVGRLVRRERETAERLRRTAAELEASRAAAAQAAVVAERARMAREVHDSVAHSVSVMVLQMGGLRRLLPHEPRAQEVLAGLEQLGREAVDEMRRAVGVLRQGEGGGAAPDSLERLEEVVAGVRAGGVAVALSSSGRPVPLAPQVGLCAVRVVQEALSNAVRHAPGSAVAVDVRWSEGGVTVTVTDDGRRATGDPVLAPVPGGSGLRHMRERVGEAGGSLATGPLPGGGWRVRVELPAPTGAAGAPA